VAQQVSADIPAAYEAREGGGPTPRILYGYARTRSDSTALEGVKVQVIPAGPATLTDSYGRYELRLPQVADSVHLTKMGYGLASLLLDRDLQAVRVDAAMGQVCIE